MFPSSKVYSLFIFVICLQICSLAHSADLDSSTEIISVNLYTRRNPKIPQYLATRDSYLQSNYNSSHPTRILFHGWMSDGFGDSVVLIRDAYLESNDFNIIIIDWSTSAHIILYYEATERVPYIAREVVKMIQLLYSAFKTSSAKLILVGHSLGSHIAGYVGKQVIEAQLPKLRAIVGLDVPEVYLGSFEDGLQAGDADYVQLIQTSIWGVGTQSGHANFYPNYAKNQPTCMFLDTGCSHSKSYSYFAESILASNQTAFWARKCKNYRSINQQSCEVVEEDKRWFMGGEPLDFTAEGVFYLRTHPLIRYSMGWE